MQPMKTALAAAILYVISIPVCFGADVAKIGVVEFQRLFENSDAGKDIKAEITTQGKKMEAELKEKGTEIEELKKRIEREDLVLFRFRDELLAQLRHLLRMLCGDVGSLAEVLGQVVELKYLIIKRVGVGGAVGVPRHTVDLGAQ